MTVDAAFYSVAYLLHADGADAAVVVPDVSLYARTVTAIGNAQLDTAQFKFGTASLLLDGTGDGLSIADTSTLRFGTGDFTVEFQQRYNSKTGAQTLMSKGYNVAGGWVLQTGAGDGRMNWYSGVAATLIASESAGTINTGQWYHIEVNRVAGVLTIYRDGVVVATGADATDYSASTIHYIGGGTSTGFNGNYFNGWLDDIRMTIGTARHTAAFTPPSDALPDEAPPPPVAVLAVSLPMLTSAIYSGPALDATLPALTFTGQFGIDLDVSLPALQFVGNFSGSIVQTLPMLTFSATGHDSRGEQALDVALPMLTFAGYGGANAYLTLPALEFEGTATFTGLGQIDARLPALEFAATGTTTGTAALSATLPMLEFEGHGGAVLAVTLGALTGQFVATAGGVARITGVLPMFDLVMEATAQSHGSIDVDLPALQAGPFGRLVATLPMLELVASGYAVVEATYEAYSLNLRHRGQKSPIDELTRYTNFPFTRVVRYQGSYYAVAADGLYLLGGATDDGDAIPFAFKTGMDDFGTPKRKAVESVFFAGRMGPATTITLYAGEPNPDVPGDDSDVFEYEYETARGAGVQNYRQKLGRGIKATHFAVGAEGEGALSLATLELMTAELKRRI